MNGPLLPVITASSEPFGCPQVASVAVISKPRIVMGNVSVNAGPQEGITVTEMVYVPGLVKSWVTAIPLPVLAAPEPGSPRSQAMETAQGPTAKNETDCPSQV